MIVSWGVVLRVVWVLVCFVCCLQVPAKEEYYVVCEREIWGGGEEFVVLAWKGVCRWCRMCCFGIVGLRGKKVVPGEGRVIVRGCNVYDVQELK